MALTVSSASHEAVRPDPSRPSARQLSAGGAADGPRLRVLQRACNGLSSTALSSHRHHPCSWPSSRSGRRVSSSANPGVPCGRTASLRATSGRLEHVRDVNRAHGACGWLYPPLARSVSCDRGPPSASSDSSVGSRRAAEGLHATPSSDGCAAPLAASGSGEHARDVLSTPSARLQVGSSRKAVVPRERRWLVAEWNGRAARAARGSRRRAGAAAGARHGRLQASQAPSRVPRNSYRPWGHQGPLGGAVGAL